MDGTPADVFQLLKRFPSLEDVTLDFFEADFNALVKYPDCKRLAKLTMINPGKTHTSNDRAPGRRN